MEKGKKKVATKKPTTKKVVKTKKNKTSKDLKVLNRKASVLLIIDSVVLILIVGMLVYYNFI